MNRATYYTYIEEKLTVLCVRIESRGKLNILDLHLHSESFYLHFFNLLFSWKLENLNAVKQNVPAIDLIENNKNIVIQVSATATKNKIESALTKDLTAYANYGFRFISISKDAAHLRGLKYKNPHGLNFDPADDIYDVPTVLKIIFGWTAPQQKIAYDFIKAELGTEVSALKIETNLATIANILAKEDLSTSPKGGAPYPYDVDKKIAVNKLVATKSIIEDHKIHYSRLNDIYEEFSKQGSNKSLSVLSSIRGFYIAHMNQMAGDELFLKIISCAMEKIQDSSNFTVIPYDELELCVNIIVVDAFIRCKIFENPQDLINAPS